MLWKSSHPDLDIPADVTTWQWAFENKGHSPLYAGNGEVGSYVDAVTEERIGFVHVKDKATKLSTAFVQRYGLQPGETVSLFSTNTIWYPVAMWAALRVGGCVNGASPAYNAEEMAYALKTAQSKVLLTLPSSLDVAVDAADKVGIARSHVLLLEGERDGFTSIRQLIEEYDQTPATPVWSLPPGKSNREVCGYLNFSSGTTGLPKAVQISHHNVIAQCHQLRQLQVVSPGQRYRILAVMPLFHITGLVRFCTYPLLMNGDCVMLKAFEMHAMLKAIIHHRIEELILVPPILIRMAKDAVVEPYLPELREIVKRWSSGSAPIAPEVTLQLQQKFPSSGFRQGYGATESTACISAHPPTHFDYKYAATAGKLVANTTAKVISLTDPSKLLGPNETGEILAKGPQIAMGYLNNPSATAETFDAEGYLHTGDVGHIDDEGLLHISDRIKEMLKIKGQQVAPAELEDLLLGHEDVEDAAVLGIPDDYAGERPKAFVVLKKGIAPSERVGRGLLAFCRERKIRYKWLKEVEFVEAVPKSATGKLLRRVLKGREREVARVRGVVVRDEAEGLKAKL
ncbi:hypothetical protein MBLNU230_g2761t1 [Neophaeotheca triangularis]